MSQVQDGSAGVENTWPKCSIIIITYNGREMLSRYLASVLGQDYPDFEVVLVDNASTDGTSDFIAENYRMIKVVKSQTNTGTAEGSNIGARAAAGDLLFFIHNDMILEKNCLSLMVKTITSSDGIGVCTCKVLKLDREGNRTDTIDSVGGTIDKWGFPSARGIGEQDRGQYDDIFDTFFSFGGPMLIKKCVFEEVGEFDPVVFTLADDIDLCWRAKLKGYRTVVNTKARVYHHLSATLSAFARSNKRFISERNTMYMMLKNYSTSSLVRRLPLYLCMIAAEASFLVLLGKRGVAAASLRAVWWNMANYAEIRKKRVDIQASRTVSEKEIVHLMMQEPQKLMLFADFLKNRDAERWSGYFGK